MLRHLIVPLLALLLSGTTSCQVADSSSALSNDAFRAAAADTSAVVLDVRTTEEFQSGHINKANHIDVLQESAFRAAIAKLPLNKPYLLYCRSGKRSGTALAIMKEAGFTNVRHLANGISGWDGPVMK